MPYMAAALVALAAAAAIAWWRSSTGEYCSPFSVVVASWGGVLALFLLRLLPYRPISGRAAAIIALGVGCLLAGILLARRVDRRPAPRPSAAPGAEWWAAGYAVLGIGGTAWYLWLVDRHLGWASILYDAARVRYALVTYEIPSRFLFLQFFCMASPLVALSLVAAGRRLRWWVWVLVLAAWSGTLLTTDRTQFFIVLLTTVFMWLYRRGPALSLSRLAVVVGVAGVLLAANFLIVGYWVGKSAQAVGTSPWVTATAAAPPLLPRLAGYGSTVYLYATGSLPAFAAYVEAEHSPTYGVQALYPVARLLQRAGVLTSGVPSAIPPSVTIVEEGGHTVGFNAYTFLYYPYQDFGGVGVAVYCLLIGMLAGMSFERMKLARTSALHLLVIGQISTALALSVFVNKFNNTASWYIFVLSVAPFVLPRAVAGSRRSGKR